MQGKRNDVPFHELKPGDYGKSPENGVWYCRPPWQHAGGSLRAHTVTEHEDGTITVSPSILIKMPPVGEWHGFLERGVWREC